MLIFNKNYIFPLGIIRHHGPWSRCDLSLLLQYTYFYLLFYLETQMIAYFLVFEDHSASNHSSHGSSQRIFCL